jgi:peptide/nickel transport system ATP-binding protein
MYAGKVVEHAPAQQVFRAPQHPYTWGLLSSMPRLDRDRQDRLVPIAGSPPSLINVPDGCAFHPRCRFCELSAPRSLIEVPVMTETTPGHGVACHLEPAQRRRLWIEEVQPLL